MIYFLRNRVWSPRNVPTDGDLVQLGMNGSLGKREVVIDGEFTTKTNYLAVNDLICFVPGMQCFEIVATANPCLGRLRLMTRNQVKHEDYHYYPLYIEDDFDIEYLEIE